MIITIHGKNMEITPAINKSVETSLTRLEKFKKFIQPNTRAKVEIRSYPEKLYKVSVNINIPFDKHLQCEVKHEDLYLAIKQIVNPLSQQLNRIKTQTESKGSIRTGETILTDSEAVDSDYQVEQLADSSEQESDDFKSEF